MNFKQFLNKYNDNSIIRGSKLNRTNLTTRAVTKFGAEDKWTMDTKVQYVRTEVNNRPLNGNNSSNSFLTFYTMPVSVDIREFKNPIDKYNNMTWYNTGQYNPYWMAKYNTTEDIRDRFIMSANLKYQIYDWLSAEIHSGIDLYNALNPQLINIS